MHCVNRFSLYASKIFHRGMNELKNFQQNQKKQTIDLMVEHMTLQFTLVCFRFRG